MCRKVVGVTGAGASVRLAVLEDKRGREVLASVALLDEQAVVWTVSPLTSPEVWDVVVMRPTGTSSCHVARFGSGKMLDTLGCVAARLALHGG